MLTTGTKLAINCIVETPKGYGVKYNYDSKLACFELSKILPAGLVFPFDFGFIPGTKGEDGDPLDVIIISEAPSFPGCAVKCRIIGSIKAVQQEKNGDKMRNDRYIAIPEVSEMYKTITKINQLPHDIVEELQRFFINYNSQAGKKFQPIELTETRKALDAIAKAKEEPEPTKLIQLLLPLYNNDGKPFPERFYNTIRDKLSKRLVVLLCIHNHLHQVFGKKTLTGWLKIRS